MFESTLKEFSKYPDKFETLYLEKINKRDTIVFDFEINGYKAFVHFNNDLFNLIIEITNKNNKLNNLYNSLPPLASTQYIRNSLVVDVKNTNEIEQVFSSKKEIFELAEDLKKRKSDKVGSIVSKYLMLLENETVKKQPTLEEIRSIYDQMFANDSKLMSNEYKPDGKLFRKGPVGVYAPCSEKPVHNGIFPEDKINKILNIGLDVLQNKNINIFIRIALFHFIFEYVHPFYDGNGRVGRYISSMLFKQNLSDIFAFRVSAILKDEINKYYKAFEDTEHIKNRADLTTFVYGFISILLKGYDNCIEYAESKLLKLNQLREDFAKRKIKLTPASKKVMDVLFQASLFSDFGVNIKMISDLLNLSAKTVRRSLIECNKIANIQEEKFGKFIYYFIEL